MGVAVQLVTLVSLTEALGLNYLVATVLAVETAILHNFVWHEHWTWRDRGPGICGRWTRLAAFNLVTGALSIASNVTFTALYVSTLGVHYAIANLMAIATCSLLTFVASDRLVFCAVRGGEDMMTGGSVSKKQGRRPIGRMATLRIGLAAVLAAACPQGLAAAELQDPDADVDGLGDARTGVVGTRAGRRARQPAPSGRRQRGRRARNRGAGSRKGRRIAAEQETGT